MVRTATAEAVEEEEPTPTEIVLQELQRLESAGRLTPDDVVKAARDKRSPLHEHFEWDDSRAGHAFRLVQARRLIRGVRLEVTIEDREVSVVYYVRDPAVENDDQGYVSLAQIRSEPGNARLMLEMELGRVASLLERAETIAAAIGLDAQVRALHKRTKQLKRRVEAM